MLKNKLNSKSDVVQAPCGLSNRESDNRKTRKEKLNFHFNLSLTAVNMANYQMEINPTIMSINTLKRIAYNTRFANFLFTLTQANSQS